MRQVLLAGCGNIGFRHLQALCTVPEPVHITVVEPNSAVHGRITTQFDETSATGHTFALLTGVPTEHENFDLVIVATAAAQRRPIVEAILEHHGVTVMILEKILFQTVGDLDAVGRLFDENDVRAFVNCGRRTFDGYRQLRARLAPPVDIEVRGQGLGLASNAVHFLDLLEFLNGDSMVSMDATGLDAGSIPGKRPGVVEIFGTIAAELANGARLSVESLDADPTSIQVHLRSGSTHVRIDELTRTQFENDRSSVFSSQNVSETTEIYVDALTVNDCALTPYADSVRQHRFFLTEVRSHLGLSNADDVPCPVS